MRITSCRRKPPPPDERTVTTGSESYIRIRVAVERGRSKPVFIVEVRDEAKQQWERFELVDGERIDMTVFVP